MPHGTFGATYIGLDGGDDADGDLVLQREHIGEIAIVAFGPEMAAILGIDELARDCLLYTSPSPRDS